MIWLIAGLTGYICGQIPAHAFISHFSKAACLPTVISNVSLKQYKYGAWLFCWFFITPFILWYVFYAISLNPYIASICVTGFTLGNGIPIKNKFIKHKQILQIYPFVSLLFILSFKIAILAIFIGSIIFLIIRKPLKTRAIFVFTSLILLMLFPEKPIDIFYIFPIGILLLSNDYVTFLNSHRESKFKWI